MSAKFILIDDGNDVTCEIEGSIEDIGSMFFDAFETNPTVQKLVFAITDAFRDANVVFTVDIEGDVL